MGKLYLVNTAIEDTWPTDGPILFLGEWCRLFNRKNIWSLREQKIVNYHWDDRKKYLKDYHQINSIYEEVLVEMTSQLNQMHNVNYSSKYWRILIGPWLIFFIQIIFDRWTMLKIALKNSEPLICNVLDRDESQFIAQNMLDFGDKAINDDWNEIVFSQLLQAFFSDVRISYFSYKRIEKGSDFSLYKIRINYINIIKSFCLSVVKFRIRRPKKSVFSIINLFVYCYKILNYKYMYEFYIDIDNKHKLLKNYKSQNLSDYDFYDSKKEFLYTQNLTDGIHT